MSSKTRPFEYDTRYYHSTWSSAWLEGAQAGLRRGLNLDEEANERARYKKEFAYALMLQVFGIDGRNYPFPPFCTRFNASEDQVRQALEKVLPLLGNKVKLGTEDFGIFGTEFHDRQHATAKWRDRYLITLRETTDSNCEVTVFRELLISRYSRPYDRAQSNGHNEAWLLQQVAAALSE